MPSLSFLLSKVCQADYGKAWKNVKDNARRAGRTAPGVALDMLWCALRYGAAFTDYHVFGFAFLRGRQRRDFILAADNKHMVSVFNSMEYRHIFENKTEFCRVFSEFLGRPYLVLKEANASEFSAFLQGQEKIFVKKDDGFAGRGIACLDVSEEDPQAFLERLRQEGYDLAEHVICQHSQLAALAPASVNTVRMVSVLDTKGQTHILLAALRCGRGSRLDNLNAGGLAAMIDLQSGCVYTPGKAKDLQCYETHPVSGIALPGFRLPYWQEALEMVRRAATRIPEVAYVGWDVAFTPTGPCLIEGNYHCGHDILQIADGVGKRALFQPFLDERTKKNKK
ncbi:MAG: hypothetical protein IKD06_06025 [Clostridia bacterium]|nr:hypothetical protein [Clostridia bacterium]